MPIGKLKLNEKNVNVNTIRNKLRLSILSFQLNILTDVLAEEIRNPKETKRIQIGNEDKVLIIEDNMIVYISDPQNSLRDPLD